RMAEALVAGKDVGVESATGTGKTYWLAVLALWFVASWDGALVVTTAPKEEQLTLQLWREIGAHWPRFKARYPEAGTVKLRVRMRPDTEDEDGWAIVGYGCGVEADSESATRAQGFHRPHMLLICEETPGIPQPVLTAQDNTATGTHNLRLRVGNPDHQLDPLHTYCTAPGITHIRISALDHPNVVTGREVIPGACTRKSLADLKARWGDGSAMYVSRARGISPAQAANALIRLEWLEAAAQRFERIVAAKARGEKPALLAGAPALGVDVANSEAGDRAAIAFWLGRCLVEVTARPCANANELGREVMNRAGRDKIDAEHIGIDAIGVGAATVNTCRDYGLRVQDINSGLPAQNGAMRGDDGEREWETDATLFANLRAQMWWQLRIDLEKGVIAIRRDEALFRELVVPTYESRGGRVLVEAKDAIRKRLGGASPDRADAAVYGNWVRSRAAPDEPELREGQHPNYEKRGGTVQRIGRQLEHERTMREFRERGGYISGLGLEGFHVPREE
ncbi:MAG TPA: hypothetical protein VK132_04415, partial [Gemmatimonadales bacterium]|nr:hypothetical protein [Gemmatimonadales bacterium]